MGISGLLPLLKSIHKPTHLRNFAGQTLGVDAYGWLHRGTVACAVDLALDKPTRKYVDFAMHRVRMLIYFGVTPYLVFDGDYLPSKASTEQQRATRREDARRAGLQLLKAGKTAQAHLELQKAVDVTPEMAGRLIAELKRAGVAYVVAPYEADSQMAYLERKGVINGIISEDSDLLVFGARVLLTKLDQYGECVMLRRDDFTSCREVSLLDWGDSQFRQMAILSGCDYLDSIGGLGLKTANRLLRRHKTVERAVKALQFDGKFKAPLDYLDRFGEAERTFLYQWVFCPLEKRLVHLTPLPEQINVADLPYIGSAVEPDVAAGVASGALHPHTKKPLPVPAESGPASAPAKENSFQTPLSTKHKPIESFFRAKRTPLAELDPNSFTPPDQRGQLTRTSLSRAPSDASRRQADSFRSLPSAASQTVSAPVSAHRSRAPPVKRMRLCSDASLEVQTPLDTPSLGETSKFFAVPDATPSRIASPKALSRKRQVGTFEIFSDDSIADAFADLDESLMAPVVTPGASNLERRTVGAREDSTLSRLSTTTTSTSVSQRPESMSTQATSVSSLTPAGSEVHASNADIKAAETSYDDTVPPPTSSAKAFVQAAGGEGSSIDQPLDTITAAPSQDQPPMSVRGSEDLLVPDSEDEAGSISEEDSGRPTYTLIPVSPGIKQHVARAFDLSKFAFTG